MPTPSYIPQRAAHSPGTDQPLRASAFAGIRSHAVTAMRRGVASTALFTVILGLFATGAARADEWKDVLGNTFSGTAVEALGPFAIFSTKPGIGRWVPMQALPLPELVRFAHAVKDHPPRATDWATAKSTVTAELRGHFVKLENEKLVPSPIEGRAEPAVIVALLMNRSSGDNWKLIWPSMDSLTAASKQTPRMVECVVYGRNYTRWEFTNLVKDAAFAPWLLIDPDDEEKVGTLRLFASTDGYGMVAVTRDGVPLFGVKNPDEDAVKDLWKKVLEFSTLLNPSQPLTWKPLAYYRTAVQIDSHPTGHLEPELIGSPFRAGALSRHNLHAFDATLKITADGTVSEVTSVKAETPIPPKVNDAIVKALKLAVFVPAIENGTPVASDYSYHYKD